MATSELHIQELLTSLCSSADKKLRVIYDKKKIEELRKKESIIEFRLKEAIDIDSDIIKEKRVKKIFIPVSGKLRINAKGFRINFFVGNAGYSTSPFSMGNKKVFKGFMKLMGVK